MNVYIFVAVICLAALLFQRFSVVYSSRRYLRARPTFERADWLNTYFPEQTDEWNSHAWAIASIVATSVRAAPGQLRGDDQIFVDYCRPGLLACLWSDDIWEQITSDLAAYSVNQLGRDLSESEVRISDNWRTLNDIVRTIAEILSHERV